MQATIDRLIGFNYEFCLDQYRCDVLSPLDVCWLDYLDEWQ